MGIERDRTMVERAKIRYKYGERGTVLGIRDTHKFLIQREKRAVHSVEPVVPLYRISIVIV